MAALTNIALLGLGAVGGSLGSLLIEEQKKKTKNEPDKSETPSNQAQLQELLRVMGEKDQQIQNMQLRFDQLSTQHELLKKSSSSNVTELVNDNDFLKNQISNAMVELEDVKDNLSNCSVNLQAFLNQSTNEFIVFINRLGTQFDIASFRDVPLVNFEIYLTVDRRNRILNDLKSLFLSKCFNLPFTSETAFILSDEKALVNTYAPKAFVSRIFGILYELNLKNLFLI